jgi:hypothetical protein
MLVKYEDPNLSGAVITIIFTAAVFWVKYPVCR